MSGHVALFFKVDTNPDALEGFFLTHSTLAGIEEKSDGTRAFYLAREEWTAELRKALAEFTGANAGIEFLRSEEIPERDWNAEWEASVMPERATAELVISPSWRLEEAKAVSAKHIIIIDPKMSFGTGHHETTRLCLGAIEALDVSEKHVLDLGTGTGVLAIYAILRGAAGAVGVDTDHWSIENAAENRSRNEMTENRFELRLGTLESALRPSERYQIILANLHRNLLIENAEGIRRHAMPGGRVVLSGILIYDEADIRQAYEAKGFRFMREWRENEWAALLFES